MLGLGILLSGRLDPAELTEARVWYDRAAAAGDTGAMSTSRSCCPTGWIPRS